ncbi:hypothetical protein POM88_055029 [Heracleum sosnowskyi]|uniref:Reverse transcriptase n=1 Tax=Heracleum sosnowskyi TaxID=360622 RepID=A0AAD8GLM4_9APIA|nr:hypothetical protein POM88_055029 [Heracleum sosnowskyi]
MLLATIQGNQSDKLHIQAVLKKMKLTVQEWNKHDNGKIGDRISELEKKIACLENDGVEDNILTSAKADLKSLYNIHSNMLRQKSRTQWLLDADKNTRFYHQAIQKRRKKNQIRKIWWNDGWLNKPTQIKEAFFSHFSEFFKDKSDNICFGIGDLDVNTLSENEAEWIQKGFSEEEIHFALCQLGKNKAPGPDGLASEFLIKWWKEIKDAVMETVSNFEVGKG